jgi:outer membrane protein assembly factor BamA
LLALQLLAPISVLDAQQLTTATISYEGQNVSSVDIAGRPDLNLRQLRQAIAQPVNAPYSKQKVDETIANLKKTGQFTDAQVDVRPEANGLKVLFVVQPAMYFGMFDFGDATKVFTYTRLLQVANYSNQEPYTAGRVDQADSDLLTFFHRTGYFLATVEPELHTDAARGIVNVVFHVNLKRKAKFGNIVLTGTTEEETKHLAGSLHSWGARIRGAYLKTGKAYSLKKLDAATTYLQGALGKQHYLAGQVKLIAANYNPQTNRADITFKVTQGPVIAIKTEGARVSGRSMKKLIPVYQENAADDDLVEEGARNLVSYFQAKGYFDAKVHSRIDKETAGITILYQIVKGKKGKVGSIDFHGNHKFDDDDLSPHVAVVKGRFFSRGKYSAQLLRKSVKNLEAVYKNAGYSQVKVTPGVTEHEGKLAIAFQVDEGVQDVVDTLKVEGNHSLSENDFAPKGLNLTPGKPFSSQLLDKDRDQIMAVYLNHGYLTASFAAKTVPLKSDPHKVEVVYTITEGPQVHAVTVETIGANHTRPQIIARNAKIPVGKPLSETELLESESNLYTLGVFDWASVDSRTPLTNQSADVLIKVHEAKRNDLTYGLGFEVTNRGGSVPGGTVALPNLPPVGLPSGFQTSQSTFWGPRVSMEYKRLNFRGLGETVSVGGLLARLDQRGAASWSVPNFLNSIWSSNLTVTGERTSENPIFTARLAEAGFQVQRTLDAKKTETIFLRYSFRRTSLSNLLIPELVTPEDLNERLSTLSTSFVRDTRDNALDAHRGIYESFDVAVNPSVLGSNTNFLRFLGQTAYYQHIGGNNIIWANSLRIGLESAFAGSHVPLSERFFSGGGSTLRGFPLNGAGTQQQLAVCGIPGDLSTCGTISVPLGGKQLVILNSEVRFPIPVELPFVGNKLGGVAFYDGGNVYNSVGFQNFFSQYSNTLGFGLRYATPVGPVRIDIGQNLNPLPGVKSLQWFITLGQAF